MPSHFKKPKKPKEKSKKIKGKDTYYNIYIMKCKYRNCDNEFEGRPNKLFCKVQCKRNELKYKQRSKKNEEKKEQSITK